MNRTPRSSAPRTSVKVRAALAAGLVFGVAAGLTVASWTDAEVVANDFTTSTFALQTNPGTGYVTTPAVTATATGVYPGASGAVYVPVFVKTVAGSVAGSVTLAGAVGTGALAPALRYRILPVASTAACSKATFDAATTGFLAGGTATYQAASAAFGPTAGRTVAANAGAEIGYCVEFSLPTGLVQATYQSTTASVVFTFAGTSS